MAVAFEGARTLEATMLIVPGLRNSGPNYWQTLWQSEYPRCRRVEQRDWDQPVLDEWAAVLDRLEDLAANWGSELVNIGPAGHINAEAGFGPWPQGERLLARLLGT